MLDYNFFYVPRLAVLQQLSVSTFLGFCAAPPQNLPLIVNDWIDQYTNFEISVATKLMRNNAQITVRC